MNHFETNHFETYLKEQAYSENTIRSYLYAAKDYNEHFDCINGENLKKYREQLSRRNSAATVNQRLNGLNAYIRYTGLPVAPSHLLKIRKSTYLDNVITRDEYERFKCRLYEDQQPRLYFLIRLMASTGMRISEVLEIRAEDARRGYKDVRSKGNKERRIYIPNRLNQELTQWLSQTGQQEGYLFRNHRGGQISPAGARYLLRFYALRYGIPVEHVHPHSFRHRFALNFIECHPNLALLSDLLGHESIETTRIYLKQTRDEQRELINLLVDW